MLSFIISLFITVGIAKLFNFSGTALVVTFLVVLFIVANISDSGSSSSSDSDTDSMLDWFNKEKERKDKELEDLELRIRRGHEDQLTYSQKLAYRDNIREHLRNGENVGPILKDWYEDDD